MTRNGDRIYLDWNATAPTCAAAQSAMANAITALGNPSSVHAEGRKARASIEAARATIAGHVGANPRNLVFTSGGTEANNLALSGIPDRPILVSAIEHDSILAAAGTTGRLAGAIPVNREGIVDFDALNAALVKVGEPALVSIMAANNETGAIQPIAEIADCVHSHGGLLHVDAIQAVGRIPFNINDMSADLATLSSHKIAGPMGVGALVFGPCVTLNGLIHGGGQERGLRAGSENLPGILGFEAAMDAVMSARFLWEGARQLRDRMEARFLELAPDIIIAAKNSSRLPNTSTLLTPGIKGETQVMALDLAGIAVSSGSACSSGKVGASHVLAAMGFDAQLATSAIRVSLRPNTREAEIDALITAWHALYVRSRARAAE